MKRTVVGIVPNIMQVPSGDDQTRQRFTPLVYVPVPATTDDARREQCGQGFRGASVLHGRQACWSARAQAVRAEVQKPDPEVSLEDFNTLKANVAFDRDRMDVAHAELGKRGVRSDLCPDCRAAGRHRSQWRRRAFSDAAHEGNRRAHQIGAAASDIRRMVSKKACGPWLSG